MHPAETSTLLPALIMFSLCWTALKFPNSFAMFLLYDKDASHLTSLLPEMNFLSFCKLRKVLSKNAE